MAGKRTIIVHAGRHKTGTSAIQHFLRDNRQALAAAGYYYPNAGFLRKDPAHHGIALALLPDNKSFAPEVGQRYLRNFRREIEAAEGTIVISSEQFQNVPPRRLAAYLPDWNIRAIIYLRDHLHYLVSAYQQAVHARNLSLTLEEFRDQHFRIVYADMLDAWAACFGAENLSVGIYDRALFRGGNVVEDFVWRLTGREAARFGAAARRDINPSLGEPLLEFKRRINAHLPDSAEQQRALYGAFSRLAAAHAPWREKPALTAGFIAKVKANAALDVERLLARYLPGGEPPFSYDWPRIAPRMDWACDPEAIMDEMSALAPQAAAYIRAKVPPEALSSRRSEGSRLMPAKPRSRATAGPMVLMTRNSRLECAPFEENSYQKPAKLNVFACADTNYEDFAPLYIAACLWSNPEVTVEVGVENVRRFMRIHGASILPIAQHVGSDSFLIRNADFRRPNGRRMLVNSVRFVTTPLLKSEYVYIGDIDILILEADILTSHLQHMARTGLPFSNSVRKGSKRLTGLHFTRYDALYPLVDFSDLHNERINDETLLTTLVRRKIGDFPLEIEHYRPLHGIHASPNRSPYTEFQNGKRLPGWDIKRHRRHWRAFRNTPLFHEIEPHLSDRMAEIVMKIDDFRKIHLRKRDDAAA